MKFVYPLVNIVEAKLSAARGDTEEALKSYRDAISLALEMKMLPTVLQARLGAALRWFSQVETWFVGIRSGQNNLLKNGWSANRYFGGR